MPTTRSASDAAARQGQHSRLLLRLTLHKPKNQFTHDIATNVKLLLELYGHEQDPEPDEILAAIRENLPSSSAVLTDELFKGPLFPLAILKDARKFYSASPLTDEFVHEPELPEVDR